MVTKDHAIGPDPEFDLWLNQALQARLRPLLSVEAPELAGIRRKSMTTIVKVAIAAAAATIALGAGAAFASGEAATAAPHGLALSVGTAFAHHGHPASGDVNGATATDRDAHGDAVSSAAHTCARTPGDTHGDCVSGVAHKKP